MWHENFGIRTVYRGIGRVSRFGEVTRLSMLRSRFSFLSFSRSRSFSRRRRLSSISSSRLRLTRKDEFRVRLLRSTDRLDWGDMARECDDADDETLLAAAPDRFNPPAYAFGGGTALYPDDSRLWDDCCDCKCCCGKLFEFLVLLAFALGTICTCVALHLWAALWRYAASNRTRSPTFGDWPEYEFL